jgi:hypothetical protein
MNLVENDRVDLINNVVVRLQTEQLQLFESCQ